MSDTIDRETLAHWRDSAFADLLVVAIGLAAQQRPEELRTALASVFDLRAVQTMTRRLMEEIKEVRRVGVEAAELVKQVALDLDALGEQIDALRFALQDAEK